MVKKRTFVHTYVGGRKAVPPLDTSPLASGGRPPRLQPSSEGLDLSPDAWGAPKRGMPTGSEAFLELPVALGFGPATGPTLKTALCHIRTLVERRINIGTFFAELVRGKESYVIRGRIRLTATSSDRFNTLFLRSFSRAMRGPLLQVGASLTGY